MDQTETTFTGLSWTMVEHGQDVVLEKGTHRFAGTVEAFTDDRDIVWLRSSVGERRLFHVGDGYTLLRQQPNPASEPLKGWN